MSPKRSPSRSTVTRHVIEGNLEVRGRVAVKGAHIEDEEVLC